MRRIVLLLSIAAAEDVIGCTVSANVGDLSAQPVEAGSDAPSASGPGSTDGPTSADGTTGSHADGSVSFDAGCGVDFPQEATFVDVQVELGGPGNFSGGTIVAGTYMLTAMSVYYAGTTGTVQIRETLRVRGSATAGAFDRLTEAKNPSGSFMAVPPHGETSTWTAPSSPLGPTFFETPECPKKDFEGTGDFTAQGDTLIVHNGQTGVVRTYRRLR